MTRSSIENNQAYPRLIEKLKIEYAITGNIETAQEIQHVFDQRFINNLYHYGE